MSHFGMDHKNASPPSELDRAIALELRAVYRLLKQRVRAQGGSGRFTAAQLSVLVRLENDGAVTISSLARAEGMRPQSMREIIAPLQEAGFISGAPDPHDGRQTLLSLTPTCRAWIDQGRAASHDWLAETISQKLALPEREKLREAIDLLRRVVET